MDLRSQSEPPLKRLRMLSESFVPPWQYDSLPEGLKSSQEPFWGVKFLKNILSLNLKSMVCSRGPYIPLCANRQKPVFYFFEKWKSKKKKKDQSSLTQIGSFTAPRGGYHIKLPHVLAVLCHSQDSLSFLSEWNSTGSDSLSQSQTCFLFVCFFILKIQKFKIKKTKTKNAPKKFECVEVQEFLTLKGFFRSPGIFMSKRVL